MQDNLVVVYSRVFCYIFTTHNRFAPISVMTRKIHAVITAMTLLVPLLTEYDKGVIREMGGKNVHFISPEAYRSGFLSALLSLQTGSFKGADMAKAYADDELQGGEK